MLMFFCLCLFFKGIPKFTLFFPGFLCFLTLFRCLAKMFRRWSPSSPPQTLPLLCSDQQEVLNFHADLQHLYADVVAHGNALRRKRKPLEEETKEERLPAEEADRVLPQGLTLIQRNIKL